MSRSRGTGRCSQSFSGEENYLVTRWLSLADSAMAGSLRAANQSSLQLEDDQLIQKWLSMAEDALSGVLSESPSSTDLGIQRRYAASQQEMEPFLLSSLLDQAPVESSPRIVRMRSHREAA